MQIYLENLGQLAVPATTNLCDCPLSPPHICKPPKHCYSCLALSLAKPEHTNWSVLPAFICKWLTPFKGPDPVIPDQSDFEVLQLTNGIFNLDCGYEADGEPTPTTSPKFTGLALSASQSSASTVLACNYSSADLGCYETADQVCGGLLVPIHQELYRILQGLAASNVHFKDFLDIYRLAVWGQRAGAVHGWQHMPVEAMLGYLDVLELLELLGKSMSTNGVVVNGIASCLARYFQNEALSELELATFLAATLQLGNDLRSLAITQATYALTWDLLLQPSPMAECLERFAPLRTPTPSLCSDSSPGNTPVKPMDMLTASYPDQAVAPQISVTTPQDKPRSTEPTPGKIAPARADRLSPSPSMPRLAIVPAYKQNINALLDLADKPSPLSPSRSQGSNKRCRSAALDGDGPGSPSSTGSSCDLEDPADARPAKRPRFERCDVFW